MPRPARVPFLAGLGTGLLPTVLAFAAAAG